MREGPGPGVVSRIKGERAEDLVRSALVNGPLTDAADGLHPIAPSFVRCRRWNFNTSKNPCCDLAGPRRQMDASGLTGPCKPNPWSPLSLPVRLPCIRHHTGPTAVVTDLLGVPLPCPPAPLAVAPAPHLNPSKAQYGTHTTALFAPFLRCLAPHSRLTLPLWQRTGPPP